MGMLHLVLIVIGAYQAVTYKNISNTFRNALWIGVGMNLTCLFKYLM
jgi:hypothetical protein